MQMQVWLGRAVRLAVFGAVVVGAVAFVLRTRTQELAVSGAPTRTSANKAQASRNARAAGYYILFRLARQRAEAQEEALMRGILADRGLTTAEHDRAAADLAAIGTAARQEVEVEQILASQGFGQSAVVVSGGQAMVVVPAARMNDAAARRIGTDLWHLAGIAPEKVLIRPRP